MLAALELLSTEEYNRDLGNSFPSVRATAVHIYGAEWAWHARWEGISPTALPSVVPYPDVPSLRATWIEQEHLVRQYIEAHAEAGIARVINYRSLSGQAGRLSVGHMIQHVVNHASYHRGQITTMLRQMGAVPPAGMDIAAFYREVAGETSI
jgi:uncharacterized damage-inducible protein DinB